MNHRPYRQSATKLTRSSSTRNESDGKSEVKLKTNIFTAHPTERTISKSNNNPKYLNEGRRETEREKKETGTNIEKHALRA